MPTDAVLSDKGTGIDHDNMRRDENYTGENIPQGDGSSSAHAHVVAYCGRRHDG
ncbi:MAG: hypothetical protein H8F28_12255 [Fibrella sp.]|nr:hypothetical protein [Armatimonadota bacterium]